MARRSSMLLCEMCGGQHPTSEHQRAIMTVEGQEAGPEQQGEQEDVHQLEGRLSRAKDEIVVTKRNLKEVQNRTAESFKDLRRLWKDGLVTSREEFADLSKKISAQIDEAGARVRESLSQYRQVRVALLERTVPSDALRERVSKLRIRERINELRGKDIQTGGSNARGVFEVENEGLVIIQKSKGTYEYDAALPYLMQDVQSERVPRVLEVFQEGDATYKVMEKASGVQLDQLTQEQLADIPQQHFGQLVDDVRALNRVGLLIDPSKVSNLFYDAKKGFSIIDVADSQAERPHEDELDQTNMDYLRSAVMGAGQDGRVTEKIQKAIEK